ncbi:hypothetical protein [Kibdelosporangium phytohabitans]|uniref:hypothetical protein n=1 Tax=Kibdelosporangium phytohabitans TaxID=860235 RepID=UPI0019DD2CAA|nr:hypothetical protein [Kibdelosporangium phytohabitans]MBE1469319.1 hypothetical protein [Kibdelosporangium phytohabitans]
MSEGRPGRRRLFISGLLIALIPMTSAPHRESLCEPGDSIGGSLVCAPIELVRVFGPVLRHLVPSGR